MNGTITLNFSSVPEEIKDEFEDGNRLTFNDCVFRLREGGEAYLAGEIHRAGKPVWEIRLGVPLSPGFYEFDSSGAGIPSGGIELTGRLTYRFFSGTLQVTGYEDEQTFTAELINIGTTSNLAIAHGDIAYRAL